MLGKGKSDLIYTGEKYQEFIFIFTMMMALLYALVTELVGLSVIVGLAYHHVERLR